MNPIRMTTILLCFLAVGLMHAGPQDSTSQTTQADNYWSRHHQRVLDAYVTPESRPSRLDLSASYDRSLDDAEATLRDVQVGNVHERMRDLLSEANDRYWQRRFDTGTIPGDAWTPQQAGWVTPAGEPVVENWPWWAW